MKAKMMWPVDVRPRDLSSTGRADGLHQCRMGPSRDLRLQVIQMQGDKQKLKLTQISAYFPCLPRCIYASSRVAPMILLTGLQSHSEFRLFNRRFVTSHGKSGVTVGAVIRGDVL